MNAAQAREQGDKIAIALRSDGINSAYNSLAPVLAARTPFRLLDLIGAHAAAVHIDILDSFLDRVAEGGTEGGWVIIASALNSARLHGLEGYLERSRGYIIEADVWYAADIFAERVPGPALISNFSGTLSSLDTWRSDQNRWVRRAVGVTVHFWAKRSRGNTDLNEEAQNLLRFLEPMFSEWEMDTVKGIAWGLKTLGRYYPQIVAPWLERQVLEEKREHRAIMLRKALTYLPPKTKSRLEITSS